MALRKIIRGLLRSLRKGVSKLTYYDEYVVMKERLEARSVLEEVGALAASMQHDMVGALQIISNELSRLRYRAYGNDGMMRSVNRIEEQLSRIYGSTKIVSLIRGQTGYFERFMEKVEALSFIHGAVKTIKKELRTENIFFKVEGRSPLFINAYGPMLEQAVVNILKNSVEAIREANRKTGLVIITLKSDDVGPDRLVRIEIADNGRGISPEDLPKFTTLFSTKSDRKPNSGLGLFIVNRVIEVHRGHLKIESEIGKGMKVSLILPSWKAQAKTPDGGEID
jgi:signal transduction histidine kinase